MIANTLKIGVVLAADDSQGAQGVEVQGLLVQGTLVLDVQQGRRQLCTPDEQVVQSVVRCLLQQLQGGYVLSYG